MRNIDIPSRNKQYFVKCKSGVCISLLVMTIARGRLSRHHRWTSTGLSLRQPRYESPGWNYTSNPFSIGRIRRLIIWLKVFIKSSTRYCEQEELFGHLTLTELVEPSLDKPLPCTSPAKAVVLQFCSWYGISTSYVLNAASAIVAIVIV